VRFADRSAEQAAGRRASIRSVHDLIVKGGTLVDGTGGDARIADVAIDDGRISAVGQVDGPATRTIAADGLLVTPGWVDIHTHYDGQATWDPQLAPSSWHGVTTLVMGNCGVGFAPAQPDRHDWLIGLMEGVEDIPGAALAEGISWEWETFPEYLTALERRQWTVDVGTQVPHGAVRAYVMGDRGARNEPASPEDIAAMRAIVLEAIRAGALGFSTSRTIGHRAIDGEPVPGTYAAEDELFGIGSALGEAGAGVFELAPIGSAGELLMDAWAEVDWMRRLSATIDRPVTYVLLQVDDDPDLWRKQLAASLEACAEGARLHPQIAGRPTGILSGHHTTLCLFSDIPAYAELVAQDLTPAQLASALADPEVRRRITAWRPDSPAQAAAMEKAYARTFLLGDPPDYEPGPERSLTGLADAQGSTPLEVAYDAMLAGEGQGLLYLPILNYATGDLDHVREMLLHPRGAIGLSDGGAHTGTICDASMPTFMLTHWTRDRSRGETLPLEYVVKKQTHDTARLFGLSDRGTVEPGMLGDLNVIDYEGLSLGAPYVQADLPAGGRRLLQKASGYRFTIKKGTVTFADGEPTGATPGRLLRGGR
jgi:N-acyl-D-aspartate/D-glutamate deacylase